MYCRDVQAEEIQKKVRREGEGFRSGGLGNRGGGERTDAHMQGEAGSAKGSTWKTAI